MILEMMQMLNSTMVKSVIQMVQDWNKIHIAVTLQVFIKINTDYIYDFESLLITDMNVIT